MKTPKTSNLLYEYDNFQNAGDTSVFPAISVNISLLSIGQTR